MFKHTIFHVDFALFPTMTLGQVNGELAVQLVSFTNSLETTVGCAFLYLFVSYHTESNAIFPTVL